MVNLILSYINHTFFYNAPSNWTQAFRYNHCASRIFEKINVKKCWIQSSICFKLVPRLLVLEPLSEVVFRTKWELANIALPPLGNKITSSSVVCVCVCVFFQFCNLVEMASSIRGLKQIWLQTKNEIKKN